MSLCAQFLSAARHIARKRNGWTDRACAVLGDPHYFCVEDPNGVMAWEGAAHCRYCARTEAIQNLADPERLAAYQAKIAKYGKLVQS
jgi:hypothetical protein